MIGLRFLPYPLLVVALIVSACAGEPGAHKQQQAEEPGDPISPYEEEKRYWEGYWKTNGAGDRIFFDFDSAELRPDAVETTKHMVRWLNEFHPESIFMLEGHTDDRGPRDYNLDLGCRRARAMRDALIERGIAAERLGIVSYGEVRPAVLGDNEPAWAQNRRAVFIVVDELGQSNCDKR